MGAFLMGLVGGIIAAPCTGPPLLALLAYVTTTRDAGWGFVTLATYGAGVGAAAVAAGGVLGVDAAARRLDGLGEELLRHPAFPGGAVLPQERGAGAGALHVAVAAVRDRDGGDDRGRPRAGRDSRDVLRRRAREGAQGLGRRPGDGRACSARSTTLLTPKGEIQLAWLSDEAAALAEARAAGRPVLVDFSADWCTPCKELDVKVFSKREVAEVMTPLHAPARRHVEGERRAGAGRDQSTLRRRDAARRPRRLARRKDPRQDRRRRAAPRRPLPRQAGRRRCARRT